MGFEDDEEEDRELRKERFEMGRRIRKARDAKGWTQAELAEKVGVEQVAIAHYERGLHTPRFRVMKRLAKAFDTNVEYFYSDTVPSGIFGLALVRLIWIRILHAYYRYRHRRNKSEAGESQ